MKASAARRLLLCIYIQRHYAPSDIRQIRNELEMTQVCFAGFIGVSPKTVEAWEAGRNTPEGPARRLLEMVESDHELPRRYRIISETI